MFYVQITTIVQSSQQSVREFYQAIYKHLSFILNKVLSIDLDRELQLVMTKSYRDKALDAFL